MTFTDRVHGIEVDLRVQPLRECAAHLAGAAQPIDHPALRIEPAQNGHALHMVVGAGVVLSQIPIAD